MSCEGAFQEPTRSTMELGGQSNVLVDTKKPVIILLVGMAGSGKTTLATTIYRYLTDTLNKSTYTINLDPAVRNISYPINIDIRTTVNYKEVMKQYKLGPNGAIMTCLNLFATRFDQVLGYLDKRAPTLDYVLVDTPGQIEVFNWSASGTIIIDSLASTYPTLMTFIVDTPRCDSSPITMMSNMMYGCSVLYKSKLPFVAIFNKIDVVSHSRCLTWMNDYDAFQEAALQDESYMASLTRSCALAMMEFYDNLRTVGVSAATGAGMAELEKALRVGAKEYEDEYFPWLTLQKRKIKEAEEAKAKQSAGKFAKDRKFDTGKGLFGKGSLAHTAHQDSDGARSDGADDLGT
eukprot:GHVN01034677.1.p2 GENE.GHVN01034677.1~~GHVN01034677.1.p2  ORF type:complete len:348 (+),score=34.46 GHVN01034677.1:3175-4218(+)